MLVSVNYVVIWEVENMTEYKFTKEGICINTQRGKIIKKVSKNGTIGYNFKSKFYSLSKVKMMMQKIKTNNLPF